MNEDKELFGGAENEDVTEVNAEETPVEAVSEETVSDEAVSEETVADETNEAADTSEECDCCHCAACEECESTETAPKKSKKGLVITLVAILVVALIAAGVVLFKKFYNPYNNLEEYKALRYGRTVEEIAEAIGVDYDEFLEEYGLPKDMPKSTYENIAYYLIPVKTMAENNQMDMDQVKEMFNIDMEITDKTTMGELEGEMTIGNYYQLDDTSLADFKEYYGLGDDVTLETKIKDIRSKIFEVDAAKYKEMEAEAAKAEEEAKKAAESEDATSSEESDADADTSADDAQTEADATAADETAETDATAE